MKVGRTTCETQWRSKNENLHLRENKDEVQAKNEIMDRTKTGGEHWMTLVYENKYVWT